MDFGLKTKTALVLGGGGGLGKATAIALAREGARVAIAGRTQITLDRTIADISSLGVKALGLTWDTGDLSLVDARISAIEQQLGPIDILVNNTGGPPPTPASGQSPEVWSQNFHKLVVSVIAITDRVLPAMRQNHWGRIITNASSGVVAPIPNLALSNALRLSLLGWSKTLSREVASAGITVNVVLPGRIATDRLQFLDESKAKRENRSIDDVRNESLASIPLARLGHPDEFASVVAFLASVHASYVTGSVIRVDGGAIPSV